MKDEFDQYQKRFNKALKYAAQSQPGKGNYVQTSDNPATRIPIKTTTGTTKPGQPENMTLYAQLPRPTLDEIKQIPEVKELLAKQKEEIIKKLGGLKKEPMLGKGSVLLDVLEAIKQM